ncbi:hypothetical protein I4F81_000502 [Pyropia yezoensis]|uniref:Uncharacterized protein n=1 Tax=Pyropia yezoensis TaxID=2788 RepID=A0ACC3BIY8_PYRYE|nr:hypothetical protein I4F81_000502 [Neopyropia yezoensis]
MVRRATAPSHPTASTSLPPSNTHTDETASPPNRPYVSTGSAAAAPGYPPTSARPHSSSSMRAFHPA